MKCCGENRASNFCPECGQEIAASAGCALLRYVKKMLGQSETSLKMYQDNKNDDYYARKIPGKENLAKKWRQWAEWVQQKVESEKSAGNG